jgi:hypothetical protein
MYERDRLALTEPHFEAVRVEPGMPRGPRGAERALLPVPPDCPAELVERMGIDIYSKCERRWPVKQHKLGPCLVWTGAKGPDAEKGPYGRKYDPAIKRTDYVHLIVWRRVYGPIPEGLDVDHVCNIALCQRPDHLQLLTKPDNSRRRRPTRGPRRSQP